MINLSGMRIGCLYKITLFLLGEFCWASHAYLRAPILFEFYPTAQWIELRNRYLTKVFLEES